MWKKVEGGSCGSEGEEPHFLMPLVPALVPQCIIVMMFMSVVVSGLGLFGPAVSCEL